MSHALLLWKAGRVGQQGIRGWYWQVAVIKEIEKDEH